MLPIGTFNAGRSASRPSFACWRMIESSNANGSISASQRLQRVRSILMTELMGGLHQPDFAPAELLKDLNF